VVNCVAHLCSIFILVSIGTKSVTRKLSDCKDDCAMRPIYECPENFWESLYAHGYLSRHFKWAFVPTDAMNMRTKFEVRSFTCP